MCDDPRITGKLRSLGLVMSADIPAEFEWKGETYRVREMLLEAFDNSASKHRLKEVLEKIEREMELAIIEEDCELAEKLVPIVLGIKRAIILLGEPMEPAELEDIKRWLRFGRGLVR